MTINPLSGAVTDVNPAVGADAPIQGIAFSAGGTLYGIGQAYPENDHLYTLNTTTGVATLVGTAASVFDVRGIEFGPDVSPSTIIGTCWSYDNSLVVTINPATGGISTIGNSGFPRLNSLAKHPNGILVSVGGASNDQLLLINPATGAAAAVKTLNFGAKPVDVRGLAFSPSGQLYAINCRPGAGLPPHDLFLVNVATGAGVQINPEGAPLQTQTITFSPGGTLYGWDLPVFDTPGIGLIRINPATGAVTDVNPAVGSDAFIQSLAFAPDGTLYGVGRQHPDYDHLYVIEKSTGVATLVGTAIKLYDVRGIEFIPALRRLPMYYPLLLD